MSRFVNRGFAATLIVMVIAAELALRGAASAPPPVVRVVYGTTLAMYMEIEKRLRDAAPEIQVLALGDSLSMTQFQPDIFAADHALPAGAVFNASYLALTFRSQENLLREVDVGRFTRLRRVLLFVNPRRLTPEGNVDADVFRIAIPDAAGSWQQAWREKRIAPILDRSRLYGLSRYLVGASWRQIGRASSWDEVEYLSVYGGVSFEGSRGSAGAGYPYQLLTGVTDEYLSDLRRVVELFRSRNVEVMLMANAHHPKVDPFANADVERQFEERLQLLARETGSLWVHLPEFHPPADTDFLDYAHLNRTGAVAFTHWLRERLVD